MSVPGDFLSAGEFPALVSAFSNLSVSKAKHPPSISTHSNVPLPTGSSHADRAMTSKPPDYTKVLSALGSSQLVKSSFVNVPQLSGVDNYTIWAGQLLDVMELAGVAKILTGDWMKPAVSDSDADSTTNAQSWNTIDKWISLNLTLTPDVRGQVLHIPTSHEKWTKLKEMFKPASSTSIALHLISIINCTYDESTSFDTFVAEKHNHNRKLGELGGTMLPDNYIAILIRAGLPDNLRQTVAHLPDDKISTQEIINII